MSNAAGETEDRLPESTTLSAIRIPRVRILSGGLRVAEYIEKQFLIVVKTYPNPSSTYGETVCCAAIDLDTGGWARLYPITFRRLAGKQFAKFQTISCRATRPRSDTRPESWRVDQDSIQLVGEPMPAGKRGWPKRMARFPLLARSLEEIADRQRQDGTSLGMFRPKLIHRLVKRAADPWSEKERGYLRQERLDLGEDGSRVLAELEQIPWSFAYEFSCDDERCTKPHVVSIIDWEVGAAYRQWRHEYGDEWERKFREKFEVGLPATDLHLIVGNIAAHPHVFQIIGLVRPPRLEMDGGYVQQSLDLMGEQRPMAGVGVGLEAEEADLLGFDDGYEVLELFPGEP